MVSPVKIAKHSNPQEELFLAKYVRLSNWALKLTNNDRERAEDLVHDLYLQLVHAQTSLDTVTNLDGYLYRTLYNLNISQLRRVANRQTQSISVVDYDSAASSLRGADPRELIRYQDDLRQVCHYASIRKESSKAGSALILRFLHGYYPREIALIMKGTREAVEERLRLARNEARQFLQNPTQLRFLLRPTELPIPAPQTGFAQPVDKLLAELRQQVFDSRQRDCRQPAEIEQLYASTQKLDHPTLAHFVSCPQCLDEVNRILDLPPLSERFPTDTIGIDTPPRDNDRSGDGGGGGVSDAQLQNFRRRAREVLEQRPQSLRISINGNVAVEQLVTSDSCTQILSLKDVEEIDFIEILSEQQTLLLMISVGAKQETKLHRSQIELSDGRVLSVVVDLNDSRPRVEVVYSDAAAQPQIVIPKLVEWSPVESVLSRLWRYLGRGVRVMLNPAAVTASVALIMVAVLLFVRFSVPQVSANELLARATAVETALNASPELALYRTLHLEIHRSDRPNSPLRQRVEIWHSAKLEVTSRRLFEESGKLLSAELSRANGASTIYQPGKPPQTRIAAVVAGAAVLEAGEFWRIDPSANGFKSLVNSSDAIAVKDEGSSYLLSVNGTHNAALRIDKQTHRSIEETFKLTQSGVTSEVRLVETGFDQKALDLAPPSAFKPDVEFNISEGAPKSAEPNAAIDRTVPEAVASAELEIEVQYLLNRIKANLGEQISIIRTPAGALRVEAVTETEQRKAEILRALEPVRQNPAVRIEVSTVAEATRKLEGKYRPGEIISREVEASDSRGPSDSELHRYFAGRVAPEKIDDEVRRFSAGVMSHSRDAVLRASALQKLVKRFTAEQLVSITPEAKAKYLAMVQEQAAGIQRSTAAVQNELRRIYPAAGAAAGGSVGSLAEATDRLVRLSYKNDDAIRRAFTVAEEGNSGASPFGTELWGSLATAEQLAREIQKLAGQ